MKKVVLAYSGGLDTSVILKWLIDKGYEVVAYMADVGQGEDFKAAKEKALSIGAKKVYVEDLREELVEDYLFKALKCNAVYENRYLLGTSLARPLIAKRQVEVAVKEGTRVLAHGATGKGNDQVRFELTYMTLMPDAEIISPWKDPEFLGKFQGRSDMLRYAKENRIPVEASVERPYSIDENVIHRSYESGELEDPSKAPGDGMFKLTVSPKDAPDRETQVSVTFREGVPVKAESGGAAKTRPLEILMLLNKLAGENGIGRVDMVENRFVGMKSRGVYETPGYTVLRAAHMDLEGLTMDREVMHLRDALAPKISELIYYGLWFSPEMGFLMSAVEESQQYVSGTVKLGLYKGNVIVRGRESAESLYDRDVASMDVHGGYDQKDAEGFIKLNALRLKTWAKKHGE